MQYHQQPPMATIPRRPVPTAQHQTPAGHTIPQYNTQYQRLDVGDEAEHVLPNESDGTASDAGEGNAPPASPIGCVPQPSSEETATQAVGASNQKLESEPAAKHTRFEKLGCKYDRVISDHWTYELIGVFVSVVTLVSIVGILFAYQGGPTPHIMRGVSVSYPLLLLAMSVELPS